MDVQKIIAELRAEREQVEEAILALERLARGSGKRRGRPPAWMKADQAEPGEPSAGKRRRPKSAAKPE